MLSQVAPADELEGAICGRGAKSGSDRSIGDVASRTSNPLLSGGVAGKLITSNSSVSATGVFLGNDEREGSSTSTRRAAARGDDSSPSGETAYAVWMGRGRAGVDGSPFDGVMIEVTGGVSWSGSPERQGRGGTHCGRGGARDLSSHWWAR